MLIVLVIVVVAILVISIIAYVASTAAPSSPVSVSEVVVWTPDNACGLRAYPLYFGGYSASTNENDSFQLYGWQNYNSTPCVIRSITTNTTGFSLSGIQLPSSIPGNDQNVSVNLTVETPGTSFSGNLNLVFA